MLRSLSSCLVLLLLVGFVARVAGQDKPDPRAVLEKGIKALGGEDNLVKYRAATWKAKGQYFGLKGKGDDFSGEWAIQPPNHYRADVEFQRNGATFHEVRVINGDKGWIKLEKQDTQELDKDALAEEKKLMNAQWLTLVPLRDKAFQLEALPDSKVDSTPVAVIRVTRDGNQFGLYFSKDNGRLLKSERRLKDEAGKEVKQEVLYDKYKDVGNGIQHAMKRTVLRDGKKFIVEEITDYKPAETVDEKLFLMPK
jgi:hypothetical protein